MTQERLIELIEELFGGWEMNNYERAGPADQSGIDKTTAEVNALITALKERKLVIVEYDQYSDE